MEGMLEVQNFSLQANPEVNPKAVLNNLKIVISEKGISSVVNHPDFGVKTIDNITLNSEPTPVEEIIPEVAQEEVAPLVTEPVNEEIIPEVNTQEEIIPEVENTTPVIEEVPAEVNSDTLVSMADDLATQEQVNEVPEVQVDSAAEYEIPSSEQFNPFGPVPALDEIKPLDEFVSEPVVDEGVAALANDELPKAEELQENISEIPEVNNVEEFGELEEPKPLEEEVIPEPVVSEQVADTPTFDAFNFQPVGEVTQEEIIPEATQEEVIPEATEQVEEMIPEVNQQIEKTNVDLPSLDDIIPTPTVEAEPEFGESEFPNETIDITPDGIKVTQEDGVSIETGTSPVENTSEVTFEEPSYEPIYEDTEEVALPQYENTTNEVVPDVDFDALENTLVFNGLDSLGQDEGAMQR